MTTMTSPRPLLLLTTAATIASYNNCNAFTSPTPHAAKYSATRLHVSNGSPDAPKTIEEDAALQWGLFTRHHALDGEWWGKWSTYNYLGDLEDSCVAG